jgi:hypothetical protein
LDEVHSYFDGSLQKTVPHPLGLLSIGKLSVSMESYTIGHSLGFEWSLWTPRHRRIADSPRPLTGCSSFIKGENKKPNLGWSSNPTLD